MTDVLTPPGKHRNNMFQSGLAVYHPVYKILLEYATGGFPVKTGHNWTKKEIHAAVVKGSHESALVYKSIAHFAAESRVKLASKWESLVIYNEIKVNIPKQMKVSPISAIPHKSKELRSILYLSFLLWLTSQGCVPSVNYKREKIYLVGVIDHIRHVLLSLIHAFTESP